MKKSSRLKASAISSREEFHRVVDDLARSAVSLRKLEAIRDQRVQAVRTEWEPAIAVQAERIAQLTLLAEKFAEENRAELLPDEKKPGGKKSAETSLATFGFRTGMPALKLLSRWTWEAVLAKLKLDAFLKKHVRTVEEVDKAGIIALVTSAGATVSNSTLAAFGVKVVQSEKFYIEPKEQPGEVAA